MSTRIHFVSSHAQLGGAERYLDDLIRGIEGRWRVAVTSLQDGPFVTLLERRGIEVTTLASTGAPISVLAAALRLRRLLRDSDPAVVHANGVKAAVVAALASPRAPIVWAKHDFSFDRVARLIARRCALVVGVSSAVLHRVVGAARTAIVHPGIELPQDGGNGSDALAAVRRNDGPVVILVGRLHPVKGYREALQLMPRLLRRLPNLTMVFVGGEDPNHPDHGRDLRSFAAATAADAVVWMGHRTDAWKLVQEADLLLVTTGSDPEFARGEGFGYTALEAMAAGTPVAGYALGGVAEVLGPCGHLVVPGNRDDLEDAIVGILTDDDVSRRLVACGHDRVASSFAMHRFIDDMDKLYRSLAA